ncbi:histidine-type phosphatase [Acidicapsa ligni]|uniref:histidine-type phosphatase n=1 Tax=Acidicapsa ligni TaxID=542300 RepID=UPI0021E0AFE2|nr:histidine-type phosphatase [Acidicapsa ligni]
MKKILLCLFYLCFILAGYKLSNAQVKTSPDEHLKFVLILTRHGVRSPTWANTRLDEYAKDPWPVWPVAPGLLTAHGKMLMTQFGSYYRASFEAKGLLSSEGCADAKAVFIYADTDQRTLETGRGLADGLLSGCTVDIHSAALGTQDATFHPGGRIGKPDPQLAYSAVAGRMGGDAAALLPAYQMSLEAMQQILIGCTAHDCKPEGKKDLLGIPASMMQGSGDHLTDIKGPLTTAATFAEDFQLEYLEGMPTTNVGWGRVDEDKMRAFMALHAASSELIQRTPYVARVKASNLLNHILRTLEQAEDGTPVTGAIGTPGDKLTLLVGHDTNIANVAALLDLHWLINGYQRDDAAPGGALVFELWQRAGQGDFVKAYYTVQTPNQMRSGLPLSLVAPPSKASLFLPACSRAREDAPCAWKDFQVVVTKSIDSSFVQ